MKQINIRSMPSRKTGKNEAWWGGVKNAVVTVINESILK
jgi:hypothetical protein